jgi:hypothetical protein
MNDNDRLPVSDWLALPAGQELDRIIAERVMGWRIVDDIVPNTGEQLELLEHNGCLWKDDPITDDCSVPWRPSTDIAHAWEVAEHCRHNGMGFMDLICLGPEWGVMFGHDPTEDYVYAPTAPLAICRAALAAVGANIKV